MINETIINDIEKLAKEHFSNSKGSHDWDHTKRVYNNAVRIAEKEAADMDVVRIAALLHDIGRDEQDRTKGKICHAEHGAELAGPILRKYDLDQHKIDRIKQCIKTHRTRGKNKPTTKEEKVVSDADKLDAIGAVGIGRAFLFAGEHGARLHNHELDIEKTEEYSKEDTAYREYSVKLKKIKDQMLTSEGKKMAQERHEFMTHFFQRLNEEVEGKK